MSLRNWLASCFKLGAIRINWVLYISTLLPLFLWKKNPGRISGSKKNHHVNQACRIHFPQCSFHWTQWFMHAIVLESLQDFKVPPEAPPGRSFGCCSQSMNPGRQDHFTPWVNLNTSYSETALHILKLMDVALLSSLRCDKCTDFKISVVLIHSHSDFLTSRRVLEETPPLTGPRKIRRAAGRESAFSVFYRRCPILPFGDLIDHRRKELQAKKVKTFSYLSTFPKYLIT